MALQITGLRYFICSNGEQGCCFFIYHKNSKWMDIFYLNGLVTTLLADCSPTLAAHLCIFRCYRWTHLYSHSMVFFFPHLFDNDFTHFHEIVNRVYVKLFCFISTTPLRLLNASLLQDIYFCIVSFLLWYMISLSWRRGFSRTFTIVCSPSMDSAEQKNVQKLMFFKKKKL